MGFLPDLPVDWSFSQIITRTALVWLTYSIGCGIYNAYLHPLAKFPGPKLAAVTSWWKTYVEVYKRESIVDRLFELHNIYGRLATYLRCDHADVMYLLGNVVRIAPNEVRNVPLLFRSTCADIRLLRPSFISPTPLSTTRYTVPGRDGTRIRWYTKHSGRISLHLTRRAIVKPRSARTSLRLISLARISCRCNASSKGG